MYISVFSNCYVFKLLSLILKFSRNVESSVPLACYIKAAPLMSCTLLLILSLIGGACPSTVGTTAAALHLLLCLQAH